MKSSTYIRINKGHLVMKLPKGRGETRISIQVNKWIQHEYKIDDYGFYYKHCVIINCFCSKVVAKSWHKHTEPEEIGFKNSKFDLQFICLWEELVSFWTGKLHLDWNIRIYMRGYRCFGPLLWFYFYHSKCQKKNCHLCSPILSFKKIILPIHDLCSLLNS